MGFIIELGFQTIILILWKMCSFIFHSCLGLIQIIVNFQLQRIFTLLIILTILLYDIYFIAPGCREFSESCIHILVFLSPFIYLSEVSKKGVTN